ncbi:2OG-Fe(II) oxygenase family Oxidoreductase [Thecamonas trahens ATCC 50062]|uniref:2OG-Fe(II) oxygenase family Oxidoreductase n=1 Tax=Thecamonas trahens ATCC 50062 TaxID=461836 RepID=A0A0L0DFF8_THETB|nr:2OG-Fe(II) oxygenase family Oxidoreductase [Thecamonas trahens ATCC 50062]KNC50886.1 2OG-Fe(II) oxygenase family Oxidoreductase [Thecamonas trahens ATCC 50062]|eukprot:XP_013756593.1 2OG-Fe(II) oxygenase family Oxidoreductase [Thecamonas trahens ATCC 50062]
MGSTVYFEPIPWGMWSEDPAGFAAALGASFRETGFAVVASHPVASEVIDGAYAASKAFFALDKEAKGRYHDPDGAGQRGYTPFGKEHAKDKSARLPDAKEFFHVGRRLPEEAWTAVMKPTPSVREIETFDDDTYALYHALDQFGRELLRAIALHLEVPDDLFDGAVAAGNSVLRLLHYPPQPNAPPPGAIRAAAHEDISVITLLLGAEEAGLEVKHRSGEWLSLNPPPGSIVINCGDSLQRLTGGALPSTTHRVVNPTPERALFPRYSSPFFLHFEPDFVIEPIPSALHPEPPITADDFLMERLTAIGLVKAAAKSVSA